MDGEGFNLEKGAIVITAVYLLIYGVLGICSAASLDCTEWNEEHADQPSQQFNKWSSIWIAVSCIVLGIVLYSSRKYVSSSIEAIRQGIPQTAGKIGKVAIEASEAEMRWKEIMIGLGAVSFIVVGLILYVGEAKLISPLTKAHEQQCVKKGEDSSTGLFAGLASALKIYRYLGFLLIGVLGVTLGMAIRQVYKHNKLSRAEAAVHDKDDAAVFGMSPDEQEIYRGAVLSLNEKYKSVPVEGENDDEDFLDDSGGKHGGSSASEEPAASASSPNHVA